jgi:hypothetical protein
MNFFAEYKTVFVILHLIGFAAGFGAAMVSDYLFFRFVKNLKLSHLELSVLSSVSKFVWFGLGLLYLSGGAIFLSDPELYGNSSKFLLKMFVVLIITINGTVLHFYIKPRLKKIDWKPGLQPGERLHKKIAFAAGAVSINSWLIATILGSLKSIPLSFEDAIWYYIAFILAVIAGSQIIEMIVSKPSDQ